MSNKEAIYDELVSPLMAQVLEICKNHKIGMVASFAIPSPEDPELLCTSALCGPEYGTPPEFRKFTDHLTARPVILAETITTNPDGTQDIRIRRVT